MGLGVTWAKRHKNITGEKLQKLDNRHRERDTGRSCTQESKEEEINWKRQI